MANKKAGAKICHSALRRLLAFRGMWLHVGLDIR